MKEVLLRIVDDSRLEQFKPQFGPGIITAWAHIHGENIKLVHIGHQLTATHLGRLTGIIANQNPVIHPAESDKASTFIRLCNQGRHPIVFLHNVTGFMVGVKSERAGLIKKGAQLVSAVSTSTVPHISILCGASYGAGNYAMCGRAYGPRFLFAWPTSRCSVMGPEQLGGVMETIARDSAARGGREVDEEKLRKKVETFGAQVKKDSESYRTSAHLLDDGVIDPRDTRDVLGMCLEVVSLSPIEGNVGFRGLARI